VGEKKRKWKKIEDEKKLKDLGLGKRLGYNWVER